MLHICWLVISWVQLPLVMCCHSSGMCLFFGDYNHSMGVHDCCFSEFCFASYTSSLLFSSLLFSSLLFSSLLFSSLLFSSLLFSSLLFWFPLIFSFSHFSFIFAELVLFRGRSSHSRMKAHSRSGCVREVSLSLLPARWFGTLQAALLCDVISVYGAFFSFLAFSPPIWLLIYLFLFERWLFLKLDHYINPFWKINK